MSLLPLTLTINDLFNREKFGHLPRAISEEGERTRMYEVGDVISWSRGPDVAIFYHDDGQSIPAPGLIVIGKVDSGVENSVCRALQKWRSTSQLARPLPAGTMPAYARESRSHKGGPVKYQWSLCKNCVRWA